MCLPLLFLFTALQTALPVNLPHPKSLSLRRGTKTLVFWVFLPFSFRRRGRGMRWFFEKGLGMRWIFKKGLGMRWFFKKGQGDEVNDRKGCRRAN
jgi:hypothetical protein